jgi:signal peptidase II
MHSRDLKLVLILCMVLANTGCDQATKRVARDRLSDRGTISVVDQVLILRYVENDGGFLGLGCDMPRSVRVILFIAFPLIVLECMFMYVMLSQRIFWPMLMGFSFLLGGVIGNLIDRIMFDGRVSDFINVGIGRWFRTGIFNFADLSVMIGCLLILVSSLGAQRPTPAVNR